MKAHQLTVHMEIDINLRIASEADLDSLVCLAVAFREHLGLLTPSDVDFRESFAILLKDTETEFLLACNKWGVGLGYVQSRYRYSAWARGFQAEFEDVFVIREVRRCGVGRRLVEFAIARATARGCSSIGLNTNECNESAIAFYQQLGLRSERERWQGGRQLWLEKSLETN